MEWSLISTLPPATLCPHSALQETQLLLLLFFCTLQSFVLLCTASPPVILESLQDFVEIYRLGVESEVCNATVQIYWLVPMLLCTMLKTFPYYQTN